MFRPSSMLAETAATSDTKASSKPTQSMIFLKFNSKRGRKEDRWRCGESGDEGEGRVSYCLEIIKPGKQTLAIILKDVYPLCQPQIPHPPFLFI